MTLTITLVAVVTWATLASTVTVPTVVPEKIDGNAPQDDYIPSEPVSELPDSYQLYPDIPLSFELPKIEQNPIPFFAPEPVPYFTAPHKNQEPNHYLLPIPSQDLVAPVETEWNPEHDPQFFYEVPAVLTKQELPTNEYPKKYNKEIHSKEKPFSSRPKQEIVLEPIDEKQYEGKQKELHKIFQQVAKKNNKKQIEVEKVKNDNTTTEAEEQSAQTIKKDNDSEGDTEVESAPSESHDQEVDSELTPSIGIPSYAVSSGGDRINFHMVGHDGPDSYKWGFDTGKGRNRQFRFEEKDKTGLVKGHYGFFDKNGELQMVHYNSHPDSGFRTEGNFGIIKNQNIQ